jgi:hypothetical protein
MESDGCKQKDVVPRGPSPGHALDVHCDSLEKADQGLVHNLFVFFDNRCDLFCLRRSSPKNGTLVVVGAEVVLNASLRPFPDWRSARGG